MFIVVVVHIGNGVDDGYRAGLSDFDRTVSGGLSDAVVAGSENGRGL
jgi:hypothetical protein